MVVAKDREYGDDLVLAAVTKALDVDIKVHQPTGWTLELLAKEGSHSSKTLHIAFHVSHRAFPNPALGEKKANLS